jgi:hypothetical protein
MMTLLRFLPFGNDSYEAYEEVEAKVRSDEAHNRRIYDWYEALGGREHINKEYLLEVRNEALLSTVDAN